LISCVFINCTLGTSAHERKCKNDSRTVPPINPYLVVRNADRAIEFYKKAFGAEERFRMHGPDSKTVMHAELKIGDSVFMSTEESTDMKALSPESLVEVQLAYMFMLKM
jgi:uncharacterized glyoxalase superfamily protein PhnB